MVNQPTSQVIAPFDEETNTLLAEVDIACRGQQDLIKQEAKIASLNNKPLEVDMGTLAWLKIIKAYGVLYNRAIDAGWASGVHLEEK